MLLVLLGAVAAMLAIGAVNVANLMLVRTNDRALELRMRSALGATRTRIVKLLLIEAATLGCLGGVLGTAAAAWSVRALVSLAPPNLPRLDEVTVDLRVLGCGLLLTLLTACAVGLWPAFRASRTDDAAALSGAGRTSAGPARRRAQSVLAAGELGLAQILVAVAALLVFSFWRLTAVDPGVKVHGLVTVDVSLPAETYGANPARRKSFHDLVLQRVGVLPGVTGVAMSLTRPLSDAINRGVWIEGKAALPPGERQTMSFVPVSESYFDVTGMSVRRGRPLTPHDSATAERVAIVNEAFVRRYFAGLDPLSQRIGFGNRKNPNYWRRVVGVVSDARERLAEPAPPAAYIPFRQDDEPWNFASYVIASPLAASSLGRSVQSTILGIDPNQPVSRVRTIEESLSSAVAVQRFMALLASLFGVLALMLAAIGTFGVVSHAVGSRQREFAVRMAVGARSADIVRLVAGEAVRILVPALLAGLAGAALASRSMTSLLYGLHPSDSRTVGSAAGILLFTTVAATCLPLRRALSTDPATTLRNE
jgi:predicted permease